MESKYKNTPRLSFVHDFHWYNNFGEIEAAVIEKSTIDRPAQYGEPMVFRYGNEDEPKIVLAIGAVGDGDTEKNSNKYFLIDFNDITESIKNLKGDTDEIKGEIENIATVLTSLIEACGADEETGAYLPNIEDEYLKEAVSLADADNKLSEAIQELRSAYALSVKDTPTVRLHKETEDGTEISAEVRIPNMGLINGTEVENQIWPVEDSDDRTGIFHNVNVEYNEESNTLTFEVNGEVRGEYTLSEGTYIKGGEYDAEKEMLVFHYNNTEMEDLEIDVRTLINEWNTPEDGQEANGVILTRTTNTKRDERGHWQDILSARICLSEKEGNLLTLENDGVYASNKAEDIFLANGNSVQDAIDDIVGASISKEGGNIIIEKAEDGGLYANVELTYNTATNVLTLTKSGQEAKDIALNNFAFVENAWYDETTEELVIEYKSNENDTTRQTRIPVGDLFSEYEGVTGNAHTVDVVFEDHVVKGRTQVHADVRIAEGMNFEDNILVKTDQNRLYVKGTADNIKYKDGKTVEKTIEDIKEAASNDKVELEGKITAEVERATSKEGELESAIAKEVTDRTEAVEAEKTRAENAENILDGKITAEQTRAEKAEEDLQGNIDAEATAREEAVGAERTRAEGAEGALDEKLNKLIGAVGAKEDGSYIEYNTNKDGNGASYLTGENVREDLLLLANAVYDHIGNGDDSIKAINDKISNLENALSEESATREVNDTTLQNNIDAVSNNLGVLEDGKIQNIINSLGAESDGSIRAYDEGSINYANGSTVKENIKKLDSQLFATNNNLEQVSIKVKAEEDRAISKENELEGQISSLSSDLETVKEDYSVTLTKLDAPSEDFVAEYELAQGSSSLGKIQIPKDKFEIIKNVHISEDKTKLVFEFTNSDGETVTKEVKLQDLHLKVGEGLHTTNEGTIKVLLSRNSTDYLDFVATEGEATERAIEFNVGKLNETIEAAVDSAKDIIGGEMEGLGARIDAVESKANTNSQDILDLQTEVSRDMESVNSRIAAAEASIETNTGSISDIKETINGVKADVKAAKTTVAQNPLNTHVLIASNVEADGHVAYMVTENDIASAASLGQTNKNIGDLATSFTNYTGKTDSELARINASLSSIETSATSAKTEVKEKNDGHVKVSVVQAADGHSVVTVTENDIASNTYVTDEFEKVNTDITKLKEQATAAKTVVKGALENPIKVETEIDPISRYSTYTVYGSDIALKSATDSLIATTKGDLEGSINRSKLESQNYTDAKVSEINSTIANVKQEIEGEIANSKLYGQNAINISGNQVSLVIDPLSDEYLVETSNGLKLTGVAKAINDVNAKVDAIPQYNFVNTSTITASVDALKNVQLRTVIKQDEKNLLQASSEGLFVNSSLTYDDGTNTLIYNGERIQLSAGSIIDRMEYIDGKIVITYHSTTSATPQRVEFDASELFKPMTVGTLGDAVDVSLSEGVNGGQAISVSLKINGDASNMLKAVNGELYVSDERVAKLEANDTTMSTAIQEVKDNITNIKNDINNLEAAKTASEQAISDLQTKANDASIKQQALSSSVDALSEKVASHNSELNGIKTELANTIDKMNTNDEVHDNRLTSLENRTSASESSLIDARERIVALETIAGSLQSDMASIKNDLAAEKAKVDNMSTKISELEAKVNGAISANNQLEARIEQIEAVNEDLESRLAAAEEKLKTLFDDGSF